MAPVRIFSWVCFGVGCVSLIVLSLVSVGLWELIYYSQPYGEMTSIHHLLRSLSAYLLLLIALFPFMAWAVLFTFCEMHDRLDEQGRSLRMAAEAQARAARRRRPQRSATNED